MKCRTCKHWRPNPQSESEWGQCVFMTYPLDQEPYLVDIELKGPENATQAIEERIVETHMEFGCVAYQTIEILIND